MSFELKKPVRYFPPANGKYEVSAGLKAFGTPMGNDERDTHVFQIDEQFGKYHRVKCEARAENLAKYYPALADLSPAAETRVAKFMIEKITEEYPSLFTLTKTDHGFTWKCAHTGDTFHFSDTYRLMRSESKAEPLYSDAFDAIATQIQEDFAIMRRDLEDPSKEWLAQIHLCYPNHWAAEEKIGKPFNQIHVPVAGYERLAKAKDGLLEMMVSKGPFVRFAWGVATDTELNHHPANAFQGRAFDPAAPELYLRVERQTITPFREEGASLFTIRTYFLDCKTEMSTEERRALILAIESMSPESLIYKGLHRTKPHVIDWLKSLS